MSTHRRYRIPIAALGTVLLAATGLATVTAGSAGAATATPASWQENVGQAHSTDVNTVWTGHALSVRNIHAGTVHDTRGYALDTFPVHTLSTATDSLTVKADLFQPNGSSAEVDVRGQAANGMWSEWIPAAATGATRLPAPAKAVQTQVTMYTGAQGAAPSVTGITITAAPDMMAATATPAASAPLSFKVFATDEGDVGGQTTSGHIIQPNDHFVALPSGRVVSWESPTVYSVQVCGPAKCVTVPVLDKGPWNINDNYWDSPRDEFTDLPQGKPEAQAAYENGYNNGYDDYYGKKIVNPAGIDLADGTFSDVGLTDNGYVTVTYLWTSGGATPPPPPAQTPDGTAASSTLVHDGYTSVYSVDASNGHLQET